MTVFNLFVRTTVLALLLAAPLYADEVVQVEGQRFNAPAGSAAKEPVKLRLDPASLPVLAARGAIVNASDTVLPPLTEGERTHLQQQDEGGEKALRIGVGRNLPETAAPTDWAWRPVDDGLAAHVGFVSSGAQRVRLQLKAQSLPAGVELRFYSPQEPAVVYGPFTQADFVASTDGSAGAGQLWSPSVAGDTLKMEVFLPAGMQPAALNLLAPKLSHVALDPVSGEAEAGVFKAASTACYFDLACSPTNLQAEGGAVAGYLFTHANGDTGFCSGVLVNTTVGTGTPYFLTANHCISDATMAATMNPVWQFANSSCGGNDASAHAIFTTGGGQLLVTDATLDTTLVKLNTYPPEPNFFAGWRTTLFQYQASVTGIHHDVVDAAILPKLYSAGTFLGYANVQDGKVVGDSNGKFAVVQWTQGVTETGGSGSGLWESEGGSLYLKGLLSRGSASCSNPTGTDYYVRLDQSYPLLQPWLNPAH
ncbi:MAG: hypothetical protein R3E93_10320 [Thiothrix sp.]